MAKVEQGFPVQIGERLTFSEHAEWGLRSVPTVSVPNLAVTSEEPASSHVTLSPQQERCSISSSLVPVKWSKRRQDLRVGIQQPALVPGRVRDHLLGGRSEEGGPFSHFFPRSRLHRVRFYWPLKLSFALSISPLSSSSSSLAKVSTVSTETSTPTKGSSPTIQASCPGSITYASPGPRSASERSSITTFIWPETTYPVWRTWQLSVCARGLTCSDHFHPGCRRTRATLKSVTVAICILPSPKSLVSSGWSRLFF